MKIKKNEIFTTKELVENYASDKIKEYYKLKKQLSSSSKSALVERAMRDGVIQDLTDGKFVFTKLYKTKVPLSYVKLMKHPIYSHLSKIIVNNLIESEYKKESALNISLVSYYDLMKILDKKNHDTTKYNKEEISKRYDISVQNIHTFLDCFNQHLEYCLESTLALLKGSNTIFWQKILMVKTRDININGINNTKFEINTNYRRATEEEIRLHEDTKGMIAKKYNINETQFTSIFFSNQYKNAREEYFEILEKHGICFFYQGYEVYYTVIKNAIKFMDNQENFNLIESTKMFTDQIKEKIFSSIESNLIKKRNMKISEELAQFDFLYNSIFHKSITLQVSKSNKCEIQSEYENITIKINN